MGKLTAGECVEILGRQWAESEGILTAADRAKPATKEQQNLAEWANNITRPKGTRKIHDESNTDVKVVRKTINRVNR